MNGKQPEQSGSNSIPRIIKDNGTALWEGATSPGTLYKSITTSLEAGIQLDEMISPTSTPFVTNITREKVVIAFNNIETASPTYVVTINLTSN